ncbi:MAG: AraC family transcriptional regulator [Pseudomonadota bacterium]
MRKNNALRPATSLRLLFEVADELGLDTAAGLERTGLSADDLKTSIAQVTIEQEIQAIENLVRLSSDKAGLGVAVGKRMHFHAFGIWGFAILTSPTLRAAIETAIKYEKLSFVIADLALRETNGDARLEFEMLGLPASTLGFILERHSCVAMTFIRELIQEPDFQGFRIETTADDPDYSRALSELLNIDVIGSASRNVLTFPADLLDRALPKSDPVTLQYCLDQCKTLVEQINGALPPWSKKVRDAVIDDLGSELKFEDIADKLSVIERTLRRRLTDEGTSFRELYTDARMTIARELLEAAGLNVETVSWRVGYAEPASFVRAFSKKFGKTPGEIRKEGALSRTA